MGATSTSIAKSHFFLFPAKLLLHLKFWEMTMIYTFGRTFTYDKYLRTAMFPEKLGRSNGYPGGSVWKTREEAQAFVDSFPNGHCPDWEPEDFSVYGVEADWETDTYIYAGDHRAPWRSLKRNAKLIKLS